MQVTQHGLTASARQAAVSSIVQRAAMPPARMTVSNRQQAAGQPCPHARGQAFSRLPSMDESGHGLKAAAGAAAGAEAAEKYLPVPSTANGTLISKTEIAAFIQRDDMMDQMLRWSIIEGSEGGVRNFGLPMNVEPFYFSVAGEQTLWGFKVGIFREGYKLCDLGIMFDMDSAAKHEWVGRGEDGFPRMEGKVKQVVGKNFEIWKLDQNPVDEILRSCIRSYCNGLVSALNRYYAFGSVFSSEG